MSTIHHSAFEVFDVDQEVRWTWLLFIHPALVVKKPVAQFLAHKNLLKKGYELAWGVGRHILGSQLFDYWHQSGDGFNVEHYTDGDVVNEDTPVGRHAIQLGVPLEEHLSIWGPKFEPGFSTSSETVFVK